MATLLEQAKNMPVREMAKGLYSQQEHVDVAVSWAKGEIALEQVVKLLKAIGKKGSVYTYLALNLREHVKGTASRRF